MYNGAGACGLCPEPPAGEGKFFLFTQWNVAVSRHICQAQGYDLRVVSDAKEAVCSSLASLIDGLMSCTMYYKLLWVPRRYTARKGTILEVGKGVEQSGVVQFISLRTVGLLSVLLRPIEMQPHGDFKRAQFMIDDAI